MEGTQEVASRLTSNGQAICIRAVKKGETLAADRIEAIRPFNPTKQIEQLYTALHGSSFSIGIKLP
jgi:hypothetical protein